MGRGGDLRIPSFGTKSHSDTTFALGGGCVRKHPGSSLRSAKISFMKKDP